MRRLMLLRHAKSDRSAGVPDLDRPLNARGFRAAPQMAAYLLAQGLRPGHVAVSPARRTRQTWEPIQAALGGREAEIVEAIYEAPDHALLKVIRATPDAAEALLVIGHNPGLQDVALRLLGPEASQRSGHGSSEARARLSIEFPTAALAVIDFDVDAWSAVRVASGRLERFVSPKGLDRDEAA